MEEAALDVVYWADRYMHTREPIDQANALVELHNHISDLKTWLPGYDAESGTMPWDKERGRSGL